jgi:VWFA-related protein
MLKRITSLLVLSTFLMSQVVSGQDQTTSTNTSDSSAVIHSVTREVLLDMVVRDRHHHAVTDIRPEEIEVYEDGVKQKINAFHNIGGAEQLKTEQELEANTAPVAPTNVASAPAAKTPAPNKAAPKNTASHSQNRLAQLNFVSIVFAQISPLNMPFAHEAVQEFLKSDNLPNTYVTVYSLTHQLEMVQPYTSDKAVLAKAVDAAAKGIRLGGLDINAQAASGANSNVQAVASNLLADPNLGVGQATAVKNAALAPMSSIAIDPLWMRNAASQDVSITLGNALLTQADLVKGIRFSDSLSNGMSNMDALHAMVHSQERLPGRKVVLYLADGLMFPVNRRDVVDQLISYSNRSGVSFYTVDTRGLSVDDAITKSLAEQERTASESSVSKIEPRTAVFEDDDVQLSAVSNDQMALRELAEATGGFAVANTNQIADPMQRVMEDIRTHYELAYAPTSNVYDGHFRKIEVRITRPHVTVQTRSGYYALPDLGGDQVQPYEMAALQALNANPAPVTFPYEISLVRFKPSADAVKYEAAFEIPVSSLSVLTDDKTGKAHLQVSLFALVRNSNGDIIGKISRDLSREMTIADVQQLSADHIVYAEPMQLPSGNYTIDSAVTDGISKKTTVKHVSVSVDAGKDLGLSSVEVVRRFMPLNGPRNPDDPFQLASARVLPTFTDSAASGKPVALYFVVYPAKLTPAEDPKVTLEVMRDGKEVGRQPLTLPKPDADGSIPVLMQISPSPGKCDIVISAQQGTLAAQSTLSMKIE